MSDVHNYECDLGSKTNRLGGVCYEDEGKRSVKDDFQLWVCATGWAVVVFILEKLRTTN